MFGFSGAIAGIQLLALLFLPQTPHFLILKGKDAEAEAVLRIIHGDSCGIKQEVVQIRSACRAHQESSCSQLFSSEDKLRRRLLIGLGLVIGQQLTGQPNILIYATDVFQSVGFCGDMLSSLAAVVLGLVKVVATILSLCLVDRLGRRTLLLAGVSFMVLSLLGLTIFASYETHLVGFTQHETCTHHPVTLEHNHAGVLNTTCENQDLNFPTPVRFCAFISVLLFVSAYSLSFGPVTWILLTELFPVRAKGHAMSLGQAVNWAVNVLVSVTFLDTVRLVSLPAVFSFYLLMSFLSLIFIYKFVPETKNKTLEQISVELSKKSSIIGSRKHEDDVGGGNSSPDKILYSSEGKMSSPGGDRGDFVRLQEEDDSC